MEERIEKAFAVANFMATLSNQRRIILEEFNQQLVYYSNCGTFKVSPDLITFAKLAIDLGHTTNVPFVDANNLPIIIPNVQDFFDDIVGIYFEKINEYAEAYSKIKSKRKIEDIVSL